MTNGAAQLLTTEAKNPQLKSDLSCESSVSVQEDVRLDVWESSLESKPHVQLNLAIGATVTATAAAEEPETAASRERLTEAR